MAGIDCFFSSVDNPTNNIIKEVLSAKKYILIAMYTLTDSKLIDSLKKARKVGTKILAIFDEHQLLKYNKIILELNNADVKFKTTGSVKARMHHKFLVIDGEITITGSFNWTYQANKANFENIIVVREPNISIKYESEFNRIWELITSQSIESQIETRQASAKAREEKSEGLYQMALNLTSRSVNKNAVRNMEAAAKLGHKKAKEWLDKWVY